MRCPANCSADRCYAAVVRAPVSPRCDASLHHKCQLTRTAIARAAARMRCSVEGRVRQQFGRMSELGDCGSRLTQCSGSPRYGAPVAAPTSRRSCIQGLEAHARPSNLTVHPSLGSPFTYLYVQASRIVPAHLTATILPSFAKIVASSTTLPWTGSDNLQDGTLRVQQEC
jgi:hypothetical protein